MKRIIVAATVMLFGSAEKIWSPLADGIAPMESESRRSRLSLTTGPQTNPPFSSGCSDNCEKIQDACLASGNPPVGLLEALSDLPS